MSLNPSFMSVRRRRALFATLIASSSLACGGAGNGAPNAGDGDSPSASSSAAPPSGQSPASTTNPATVVAKLALANGHTITFMRPPNGGVMVVEDGLVGDTPAITQEMSGSSTSDLYLQLSNGAPVPPELAAAERDAQTLGSGASPSAPTSAPPKPATWTAESTILGSATTPTQTWFQQNYCSLGFIQYCNVVSGVANANLAQYVYTPNYYLYAMNDPTATTAATVVGYIWEPNNGGWVENWSGVVQPQHWIGEFWWSKTPMYSSSTMSNDPGAMVMAQGGVTPSCAAQYLNLNYGDLGGEFLEEMWHVTSTGFQNDSYGTFYVGPIANSLDTVGLSVNGVVSGGLNITDTLCTDQAVYNSNPWTVTCVGANTGQTATTTVVAPFFAPANCCASKGGSKRGC